MSVFDAKSIANSLVVAEQVAREAGRILLDHVANHVVSQKGPKDFVTDADLASQDHIRSRLTSEFPEYAFIGEEDSIATDPSPLPQPCWLVDPLDGTVNFVHGYPAFAVSIALIQNAEPILGVVFDPHANEMFLGGIGHPSTLNGSPIAPSHCERLHDAMVGVSFPPHVRRADRSVQQFLNILERSRTVRRMGSAALNVCYVACGRMDAYWTDSVHPWDVAAGAAIAMNSRAFMSGLRQEKFDPWRSDILVAASATLAREIVGCLRSTGS